MDDKTITESIAVEGNDVNTTINTKGWKNIIHPALSNRIDALINEFSGAKTYEEFVRIQQSINAIQGLMDFIEVKLIEGKTALTELKGKQ